LNEPPTNPGWFTFLDESGLDEKDETNPYLVREPISPYEVTAGMILPAVLVTQGDSDLPGLTGC
jgi:type IV secretory pathway VirB10-like protein